MFPQKRNLFKIPLSLTKLICILLFSLSVADSYASDVGLFFPADNQTKVPTNVFTLAWVDITVASGFTVEYDLYVGTNSNPPLYKTGLVNGWTDGTGSAFTSPHNADTTFFVYGEGAGLLQNSTTYYWKVVARVSDGTSYSSGIFTFSTIRQNTLPSTPQPVYPASNELDVPSQNLTLQWTASIDQENDPVTYKLYLGTNRSNLQLVADNLTTNSYQVPYQLEDQASYFWKVEAVDGYDQGIVPGPSRGFMVENYFNDPPTAPVALSPDNETNTGKRVIFKWTAATDKDNDPIRYNIYADNNPDPSTLVAQNLGYDQWYAIYIEDGYNRKYWKVEATDGVNSTQSNILSYVPYESPKAPTFLVEDEMINVGRRPILRWTAAGQNPDDPIYYDLYLDSDPNPTTLVAPGIRETSFRAYVKELNTKYYWKVVTRNDNGVLFESDVRSFIPWKNDNSAINIEMIDVEGGEFLVGNPQYTMIVPGFETWGPLFMEDMTPRRLVFLDDYSMAKYEITYIQYLAFLEAIKDSWFIDEPNNGLMYTPGTLKMDNGVPTPADPILLCDVKSNSDPFDFGIHSKLTWDGSHLFIKQGFENYPANWLTVEGMELFLDWAGKRAPSEVEWEYAARGGKLSQNYMYGGSNNAAQAGWYLFGDVNMDNPMTGTNNGVPSRNNKGTNIVGLKAANELGIHDISGNVREMCSDIYFKNEYLNMERYNPLGPIHLPGGFRSARGGSYYDLRKEIMIWAREISKLGETGIRAVDNHSGTTTVLLHGIVRDEHDEPMADIILNVAKSNASTTKSGRYQFRAKKGEPVVIKPSHPDYTFSPSEIVLEDPESVVTGLNFKAYLNRKVKISGKVTDQNGKALDSILINGFPDDVITLGNGEFLIHVPKETSYNLSIRRSGYKPIEGRVVNVEQSDVNNVDFTLEYVGTYTLSGTVTNQHTGKPMPNVFIGGLEIPIYTFADGTYFIQITAGWSGEIRPMRRAGISSSSYIPASFKIENFSGNMEVNFQDTRQSEFLFSGKVVDIHGNPVEGVEILGFDNKNAKTNVTGEFGIQMARYWTGTIKPKLDGYTFSPPDHAARVAASWDNPPSSTPNFVAIPPGAYTISGTITDTNGYPLQGVLVAGFEENVRTDLNGKYSVWVESAASHTIQPQLEGYVFDPEIFEANSIQSDITKDFIAKDEEELLYTVTFSVDNGTEAIESALVNFDGSDYNADATGQVVITNVVPGTYNYNVSFTGYHEASGTIVVTDQDISQTVTLIPVSTTVYTVTFNIGNGSESLQNVVLNFNDATYISDENGKVEIKNVESGTYSYIATAPEYHTTSGSIIVTDQNISEAVVLIPEEVPVYSVIFNISDGNEKIENAVVNFNGSSHISNADGQTVISKVASGTYPYTVSLGEDKIAEGTIVIVDADVTENVKITVTGLGEGIHASKIKCFPNPSHGKLNILIQGYSFREGHITIVNPLGQTQTFQLAAGAKEYVWNVGDAYGVDYNEGVYVLSIFLDGQLVDVKKVLFRQN